MSTDRLSVTVPKELGAALRALAKERGETLSTLVTEAIAQKIRLAALELTLAEADRHFGPVAQDLIAEAESELTAKVPTGKQKRSQRRSE